jgi:hypothetical protein
MQRSKGNSRGIGTGQFDDSRPLANSCFGEAAELPRRNRDVARAVGAEACGDFLRLKD